MLKRIKLENIGPFYSPYEVSFEDPYHIYTGMNGCGKTTLLDCIFWAYAQDDFDSPIRAHPSGGKISFRRDCGYEHESTFQQSWILTEGDDEALVIYITGGDYSFNIYDPSLGESFTLSLETLLKGDGVDLAGANQSWILWKAYDPEKHAKMYNLFSKFLFGSGNHVNSDKISNREIQIQTDWDATFPLSECSLPFQRLCALAYLLTLFESKTSSLVLLVDGYQQGMHHIWKTKALEQLITAVAPFTESLQIHATTLYEDIPNPSYTWHRMEYSPFNQD